MEARLDWRGSDRQETILVAKGETVLAAAEAADISLPFGCRTGACSTCTARLLEGEVTHERLPRALEECHLDDGYVLPCIATPTTDIHLKVGAKIQADLVTNPWK